MTKPTQDTKKNRYRRSTRPGSDAQGGGRLAQGTSTQLGVLASHTSIGDTKPKVLCE